MLAAEPAGDAGEQEAADRAADAQKHDQQHAEALAQPDVLGVGREMDERHEQAERHQERSDIDRPEGARAQGLAEREAGRHGARARGMRRVAVGREAVALGRRPHQRAGDGSADDGEGGEHEIGLAPADMGDQLVRQGRADQRADADAGDGDAARRAAAAHEPALHGGDARHVAEADAHADAQPVAGIDLPQARRLRGGDQADGDQQQAADHDGPAGRCGRRSGRRESPAGNRGRPRSRRPGRSRRGAHRTRFPARRRRRRRSRRRHSRSACRGRRRRPPTSRERRVRLVWIMRGS